MKWEVEIIEVRHEAVVVTVEAEDAEDAEEKALLGEYINRGNPEPLGTTRKMLRVR